MKFLLPILVTILLIINNVESLWVPKPGTTWNCLLAASESDVLNSKEQAITLDVNTKPEMINKLHNKGQKVICYFSGGTLETNRDDYDQYMAIPGLVRDKYTQWDESWVDIRKKDKLRPLIKNRMITAVNKNCDAVEVDNLGAFYHEEVQAWSDPLTKDDAKTFAIWLSELAHELGISIGLKNIATIAPELVDYFEFAVVESCSDSPNICAKYKDFPKKGKAVFTIHYSDYGSFENQKAKMVSEQKGFGYTCTFSNDVSLKIPGFAYNCDNGSTTNTNGSIPKYNNNNNSNTVNTLPNTNISTNKNNPSSNTGLDPNSSLNPGINGNLGNSRNTTTTNTTTNSTTTTADNNKNNNIDNIKEGKSENDKDSNGGKKSKGTIIILTLGCIGAIGIIAFLFVKKQKKKNQNEYNVNVSLPNDDDMYYDNYNYRYMMHLQNYN
ncbi:hypothetical protein BCR32DRAFT_223811 [Anaeromyces robustus]|uniref:alpha-galactosidase n=1 Tax=Anaeromyces robustus TaxID=1754192 RepID=A0A1Y1WU11_9FUNG|nr:hypothetical protein BCR32DRAFT_223811 [Anaeromyces robustus]|eukprot:ORX76942.1 hypothetical protein BCR32DRAFT_223811 [Anaeromyces robustus]